MISKEVVLSYIEQIPSSQVIVQKAIKLLDANELEKTVLVLQTSPAIIDYLQKMSQKGMFPLQEKDPNLNMVLTFFGCKRAKTILYSYLISIMLPKEWLLFSMTNELFFELNSELARQWEHILEAKSPKNVNKYIAASSLVTASIAICDSIFGAEKEQVETICAVAHIDFSVLLKRLTDMSIFDIAKIVGQKLRFDDAVIDIIVHTSDASMLAGNTEGAFIAKYLHLLLFFTLSRPQFMSAGLNSFLKFNSEAVLDILDDFNDIVEVDV